MVFPDLYIIFYVEEKELWIRKEKDNTRQRRNFEKHLKIIEPLKTYYRFLEEKTDLELHFIHYSDLKSTKKKVLSLIDSLEIKPINGLKIFQQIEGWINTRK